MFLVHSFWVLFKGFLMHKHALRWSLRLITTYCDVTASRISFECFPHLKGSAFYLFLISQAHRVKQGSTKSDNLFQNSEFLVVFGSTSFEMNSVWCFWCLPRMLYHRFYTCIYIWNNCKIHTFKVPWSATLLVYQYAAPMQRRNTFSRQIWHFSNKIRFRMSEH